MNTHLYNLLVTLFLTAAAIACVWLGLGILVRLFGVGLILCLIAQVSMNHNDGKN